MEKGVLLENRQEKRDFFYIENRRGHSISQMTST